jgi:hypothetical protein
MIKNGRETCFAILATTFHKLLAEHLIALSALPQEIKNH